MRYRCVLEAVCALGCMAVRAPAQTRVPWTPSVAAAVAAAKAENKVLVLAFDLAGERASDERVADHYQDATLARLAARTVNVFCSRAGEARVAGVAVAEQQAAERQARLEVLKLGPAEDVVAPQLVFVGPDGAVLSSVPRRATRGELEWAWVDAIRRVDAAFDWQLGAAARAPRWIEFGRVRRGRNEVPPTHEQVAEAIEEMRKSRGGVLRNLQSVELLMRSDAAEAVAFVDTTMKTVLGPPLVMAIDTIGVISPQVWYTVVAARLGDRDPNVRYAAAGALERFGEPRAFAALLKQYKAEKVDPVRSRLLRALASSAPAHKDAFAQIEKVLAKDPSADVRAHALLALGVCEDRARVRAGLEQALRDASPKVRSTAAYVLAWRREAESSHRLGEAAAREEDAETRAWLEAAAEVVRGGDGAPFDAFVERVLGEAPVRPGLSGLGGGAGRGG